MNPFLGCYEPLFETAMNPFCHLLSILNHVCSWTSLYRIDPMKKTTWSQSLSWLNSVWTPFRGCYEPLFRGCYEPLFKVAMNLFCHLLSILNRVCSLTSLYRIDPMKKNDWTTLTELIQSVWTPFGGCYEPLFGAAMNPFSRLLWLPF